VLDLQPSSDWIDTCVDLAAGDTIRVTATGTLLYSNARLSNGPESLLRAFTDLVRATHVNASKLLCSGAWFQDRVYEGRAQ
jgi:hypothetical protein